MANNQVRSLFPTIPLNFYRSTWRSPTVKVSSSYTRLLEELRIMGKRPCLAVYLLCCFHFHSRQAIFFTPIQIYFGLELACAWQSPGLKEGQKGNVLSIVYFFFSA